MSAAKRGRQCSCISLGISLRTVSEAHEISIELSEDVIRPRRPSLISAQKYRSWRMRLSKPPIRIFRSSAFDLQNVSSNLESCEWKMHSRGQRPYMIAADAAHIAENDEIAPKRGTGVVNGEKSSNRRKNCAGSSDRPEVTKCGQRVLD